MASRTILVTGDGSSVIAAATALRAARQGRRTLLLAAADPDRTLDTLLDTRLTGRPAPVADHLAAARIDESDALRDLLAAFGERLKPALDLLGTDPLDPEELTPLPGTRELSLLRALAGADADLLVVAAPPPAELIATLALPEQLDRYLDRLLPEQRQAARALRPVLAALTGLPMPADWLFDGRRRASAALAEARTAVEAPGTTVRLVVDAERHDPEQPRRVRAALALYRHRLDAVVADHALPDAAVHSPDPWLAALAERQRDRLAALAEQLPLLTVRRPEVALEAIADQLTEPPVPPPADWPVENRLVEDGLLVWRLPLPGADRSELELVRRGDELILGVGGYRRIVPLPAALRRCTISGAGLADGVLSVRFAPDRDRWPGGSAIGGNGGSV